MTLLQHLEDIHGAIWEATALFFDCPQLTLPYAQKSQETKKYLRKYETQINTYLAFANIRLLCDECSEAKQNEKRN